MLQRILLAAARLYAVGKAKADHSPQTAARKLILGLPLPAGWNSEEWELLATAVRYHRGAEPSKKSRPFSQLSAEQQNRVRGLVDDLETAPRRAAGNHLLEEYLGLPLSSALDLAHRQLLPIGKTM